MARTKLVCQVLTPVAAYAKNAHTNLVLAALERRGKKHPIIGELAAVRSLQKGYAPITVTVTVICYIWQISANDSSLQKGYAPKTVIVTITAVTVPYIYPHHHHIPPVYIVLRA